MTEIASLAARIRRHVGRHRARYAAALSVALIGTALTVLSNAATHGSHAEAESGAASRSGMVYDDGLASGGKAVRFGQAPSGGGGEFMSMGPDMYAFAPGAQKTIGGITLRFTQNADFQVVNGSGTVLWHTDTNATCNSSCRVVLQNDGNLVVYGPAGALWSSGTHNVAGATLLFQPRESYLTIRNHKYEAVWTSNGNLSQASQGLLAGMLRTPRAPSARSFLDSIAVNTHMDQYEGDANRVHQKLSYLGINTIRDHYNADGSLFNQYKLLAERGIRFDMIHYSNDFDVLIRDAETLAGMPNRPLIAVEGPNEINNFSFSCNGSTWTGGWGNPNGPAAKCFMDTYFARVNASSKLGGVPVYNLTGNTSAIDADRYGLLALDNHADYGNIHPYPRNDVQPHHHYLRELGSTYFSVLPSQAVITETGYQSAQTGQRTQALYYLNIYLDAFVQGFHRTYMYELTDNPWESHGFYDTADKPKQSATALHNLTTILADTGTPRDGSLGYSVTGAPAEAFSFALQRSDGSFNIILWDERQIWNGGDITPPAASATVNFGRNASSVKVYRPMVGSTAVQTLGAGASANVQLTGEPVILHLVP